VDKKELVEKLAKGLRSMAVRVYQYDGGRTVFRDAEATTIIDAVLPIIRAYVAERIKEAVEAEREACAKLCDDAWKAEDGRSFTFTALALAKRIRARKLEAER